MTAALSRDAIRALAPAAFTTGAHPKMSERYAHVTTADVVDIFGEHGFLPVSAKQDRVNQRDPLYVRHEIRLRHQSFLDDARAGEHVPQILLLNSHNGRTKLRLRAGIYRFVCSNGLVIGQDHLRIEASHTGDLQRTVADYVNTFAESMGDISKTIEVWRGIELTPSKAAEFAREAAKLRFGSEGAKAFEADKILEARRAEDDGRSLWQVYNTVQENTTKAGLRGANANGRVIAAREITGIGRDISYNDALWALAEQFAA